MSDESIKNPTERSSIDLIDVQGGDKTGHWSAGAVLSVAA